MLNQDYTRKSYNAETIRNKDIICIQEHRYYHTDIPLKQHDIGNHWTLFTASAWKNTQNTTIALGVSEYSSAPPPKRH